MARDLFIINALPMMQIFGCWTFYFTQQTIHFRCSALIAFISFGVRRSCLSFSPSLFQTWCLLQLLDVRGDGWIFLPNIKRYLWRPWWCSGFSMNLMIEASVAEWIDWGFSFAFWRIFLECLQIWKRATFVCMPCAPFWNAKQVEPLGRLFHCLLIFLFLALSGWTASSDRALKVWHTPAIWLCFSFCITVGSRLPPLHNPFPYCCWRFFWDAYANQRCWWCRTALKVDFW